jgi:hypothetical protein
MVSPELRSGRRGRGLRPKTELPMDRHKTGRKTKRRWVIFLTPMLNRAVKRLLAMEGAHGVAIFWHM